MIINGTAIAQQIQEELKQSIRKVQGRPPCLAMVVVGDHPPSQVYVNRKKKACEEIGMRSIRLALPAGIQERDLIKEITRLNEDPTVDGILVQLPLPPAINPVTIISYLSPEKDVDGLHPVNAGKLLIGDRTGFVPCTPLGIKVLLERSSIDPSGKHVVVMGRSNLVGKPIAALLLQNAPGANATVTVVHSYTQSPKEICQHADILVVAMGKPHHVTADMIKEGAVIIDVGINKVGDRIVGDVDFDHVKDKCAAITPVPGGVGPMTIAMLLSNTWKSYTQKQR